MNTAVTRFADGDWTAGVVGLGYVGLPLAVTAAERIIHRSLDEASHRDLIDEVLAEGEALRGQG